MDSIPSQNSTVPLYGSHTPNLQIINMWLVIIVIAFLVRKCYRRCDFPNMYMGSAYSSCVFMYTKDVCMYNTSQYFLLSEVKFLCYTSPGFLGKKGGIIAISD